MIYSVNYERFSMKSSLELNTVIVVRNFMLWINENRGQENMENKSYVGDKKYYTCIIYLKKETYLTSLKKERVK